MHDEDGDPGVMQHGVADAPEKERGGVAPTARADNDKVMAARLHLIEDYLRRVPVHQDDFRFDFFGDCRFRLICDRLGVGLNAADELVHGALR